MAEARTTLFNSVFMSATVWLTVASKVASSMVSIPLLACPRATRPARPNKSDRNAISFLPLRFQSGEHAAPRHHIDQKKMHARKDVVFVVGAQILQLAEIAERDRHFAFAGIIEREVRGGDAVVRGQHARHDIGCDR